MNIHDLCIISCIIPLTLNMLLVLILIIILSLFKLVALCCAYFRWWRWSSLCSYIILLLLRESKWGLKQTRIFITIIYSAIWDNKCNPGIIAILNWIYLYLQNQLFKNKLKTIQIIIICFTKNFSLENKNHCSRRQCVHMNSYLCQPGLSRGCVDFFVIITNWHRTLWYIEAVHCLKMGF